MMDFFRFNNQDNKDRTEIQAKKKQRQEYRFIRSISHRPGHTLFSINEVTGEIKEAEYKKEEQITWAQALMIKEGVGCPRKVIIEKDCVYIEALNKENALKRFDKGCGL